MGGSGSNDSVAQRVESLWVNLCALLGRRTGLDRLPLNDGCTEADLARMEAHLNTRLPEDYKALLKIANGQSNWHELSFPPDSILFLGVDEVLSEWDALFRPGDESDQDLTEDGKVRVPLFSPKRIPILGRDSSGIYLCIDQTPGPQGRDGQLVMNLDELDCGVVEESVTALLERYIYFLETGKLLLGSPNPQVGRTSGWYAANGRQVNYDVYKEISGL